MLRTQSSNSIERRLAGTPFADGESFFSIRATRPEHVKTIESSGRCGVVLQMEISHVEYEKPQESDAPIVPECVPSTPGLCSSSYYPKYQDHISHSIRVLIIETIRSQRRCKNELFRDFVFLTRRLRARRQLQT